MADRGWDLAQLWRARRWRFLLNVIDGLPGASHLGQAVADDEDEVDPNALHDSGGGRWRPSVRHQDETAVILTAIQAGIENLISVQSDREKPYRPNFIPPPLTARDRVRARLAHEQGLALSKKLFPDRR